MRRHGRVVALVAAVGIGIGAMAAVVVALVLLLGVAMGLALSGSLEVRERVALEVTMSNRARNGQPEAALRGG